MSADDNHQTASADPNVGERAKRRWRLRPRYSVSALLVVITIAAAVCGWCAHEISRARSEVKALETLRGVVGNGQVNVLYGNRFQEGDDLFMASFAPENTGLRAWVESTLGVDPWITVKSLTIYGVGNGFSYGLDDNGAMTIDGTYVSGLKDEDAHLLLSFPYLKNLMLEANPIGDSGASQIAKLQHLASINLGNTQITDAGIRELASLPKLRHLKLDLTIVTDVAVQSLATCKLESLDVKATNISDEAIEKFRSRNPDCQLD